MGGKFSIFDGNVVGEFVTLEEPSLLVQRWRLAQWPEGHFSTQEIRFDQNDVDSVTVLRVKWVGVPVGQEDVVKRNWEGYYVRSIKQTFGYVPLPLPLKREQKRQQRREQRTQRKKSAAAAAAASSAPAYRCVSWKNATLTVAALALAGIGLARFSRSSE